jgi:hypothetical protein
VGSESRWYPGHIMALNYILTLSVIFFGISSCARLAPETMRVPTSQGMGGGTEEPLVDRRFPSGEHIQIFRRNYLRQYDPAAASQASRSNVRYQFPPRAEVAQYIMYAVGGAEPVEIWRREVVKPPGRPQWGELDFLEVKLFNNSTIAVVYRCASNVLVECLPLKSHSDVALPSALQLMRESDSDGPFISHASLESLQRPGILRLRLFDKSRRCVLMRDLSDVGGCWTWLEESKGT